MKCKYKPGDMLVIKDKKTENDEVIVVVEEEDVDVWGPKYKVFSQTYNTYMERTEPFLDMFYTKVAG